MVEEDVVQSTRDSLASVQPMLLLQLSVTEVHLCAYAREGARLFMFTLYATYLEMHSNNGTLLV